MQKFVTVVRDGIHLDHVFALPSPFPVTVCRARRSSSTGGAANPYELARKTDAVMATRTATRTNVDAAPRPVSIDHGRDAEPRSPAGAVIVRGPAEAVADVIR